MDNESLKKRRRRGRRRASKMTDEQIEDTKEIFENHEKVTDPPTSFVMEKKNAAVPYHVLKYIDDESYRYIQRSDIKEVHLHKKVSFFERDPEFYRNKAYCVITFRDGTKYKFITHKETVFGRYFQDPRQCINVYIYKGEKENE